MAHHRNDDRDDEDGDGKSNDAADAREDLDKYELWVIIQEQVKTLRDDMDHSSRKSSSALSSDPTSAILPSYDGLAAKCFDGSTSQGILDRLIPHNRYEGNPDGISYVPPRTETGCNSAAVSWWAN